MKIYSKKNFALGLSFALLGTASMAANAAKGFRIQSSFLSIVCLLFGIGEIKKSISRQLAEKDKLNELDERDQLINLKSRSKSFVFIQVISYIFMLLLFIAGKIYDDNTYIYVGIGFAFSYIISLISDILTTIYYEYRS